MSFFAIKQPGVSRAVGVVVPLLAYYALTVLLLGGLVDWSSYYFGYSTDSVLFVWFLHWWPFAITHGLNPFLCHYVWFPSGYNFAWATSIPFLALLAWPITALAGPLISYNILAMAGPAMAAWAAYLLCLALTRNRTASFIGGFLFGFSMPELYQAGELNLCTVFLIPFAVLLCLHRVRGQMGRWHFVVLLGLLLAAQMSISTEMLASLCLMGALSWVVFLIFVPKTERSALWRLAADVALAAPLTICLTAPFLYYLILGLPDVPAEIHTKGLNEFEALNFFLPALPAHSAIHSLGMIAKQLRGFRPNYYTYISAPLLLIMLLYAWRHGRRPHAKALLVLLGVIAILSLGPGLRFNGHFTSIPLPWVAVTYIPVIKNIIPSRLLLYLALGASVIAALWLAEANAFLARAWRFALAALACIFLRPAQVLVLPATWETQPIFQVQTALKWTRWPEQPFFTPSHLRQALGPLPNVLLLPDPVTGPGLAWQLQADMSFTQATGYIGFRLRPEWKWARLDQLAWGQVMPDFATFFPAFCAAHKVDYILIGPGAPPQVVSAIEGLGWPHHMDRGIEVMQTPFHQH